MTKPSPESKLVLRKRDLVRSALSEAKEQTSLAYKRLTVRQKGELVSTSVLAEIAILEKMRVEINYEDFIRSWRRYGVDSEVVKKELSGPLNGPFSDSDQIREHLRGKHWSHKKPQSERPDLANNPINGFIEQGSRNQKRGSREVTKLEVAMARFENGLEARKQLLTSPKVWKRILGSSVKAGCITAAIKAVEMILLHRDELINGTNESRRQVIKDIFLQCGISFASGALIAVIFSVVIIIFPPLQVALGSLAIPGTVSSAYGLVKLALANPSRQEKEALERARKSLQEIASGFEDRYQRLFDINLDMNIA